MKCSDVRFALGAEPGNEDPALAEHLDQCPSCAAYASDMHELDRRLKDALQVGVPELELPTGPYPAPAPAAAAGGGGLAGRETTRRFALAASVAAVAVLAGLLWAGFPRQSLASDVVSHMAHEPQAWTATRALSAAEIDAVMSRSGVRLSGDLPDVTYAHRCWFRGRHVPHLVVQTPAGPVTVMVLPDESVAAPTAFNEGGYRGTLVPARHGAIAVLARDAVDTAAVAAQALGAIEFVK